MTASSPAPWRHVYRWDLDKTYLDTEFDRLASMVRIPFEGPADKVNVPGAAALLRELAARREGEADARVCIVSGSPRAMRSVLEEKLRIDGVSWHEFHLKPQLENLKRGRFRAIREQVGYKLPLLLRSRGSLVSSISETLFGDDAEADAIIYSLYADLVAGRVPPDEMKRVLKAVGAYSDVIDHCLLQLDGIDRNDAVQRIFIHLDGRTPPRWFQPFGPRLVPVFNYFQASLVLFASGHLGAEAVLTTTRAFLQADAHPPVALANMFQDALRRGLLPAEAMGELAVAIESHSDRPDELEVVERCIERSASLGPVGAYLGSDPLEDIDYMTLLAHWKKRPR